MKKSILGLVLLCLLALSGCGDDSRDTLSAREGNLEETLYIAYAANTPGTDLYGMLVGDFKAVTDQINAFIADKYETGDVTGAAWTITATGLSGTISYDALNTADTDGTYTATISLTNYSTQQLSGTLSINGVIRVTQTVVDPVTYVAYYNGASTIEAATAISSAAASGRGYSEIIYGSGWNVVLSSVSDAGVPQSYSLSGVFEIDDLVRYVFYGLSYSLSGSSLTVAGNFQIQEDGYEDNCLVNGTVGSSWASGALTLSARDMNGTVSLSGTEASFFEGGSHNWTKDNWRSDELAPRVTSSDEDD